MGELNPTAAQEYPTFTNKQAIFVGEIASYLEKTAKILRELQPELNKRIQPAPKKALKAMKKEKEVLTEETDGLGLE